MRIHRQLLTVNSEQNDEMEKVTDLVVVNGLRNQGLAVEEYSQRLEQSIAPSTPRVVRFVDSAEGLDR
jgi:hypothetical protein